MSEDKRLILPPMESIPVWSPQDIHAFKTFGTTPEDMIECAYWSAIHVHDDRYGYMRSRDDVEERVYINLDEHWFVDHPVESDNYNQYDHIVNCVSDITQGVLEQLTQLENVYPKLCLNEVVRVHPSAVILKGTVE